VDLLPRRLDVVGHLLVAVRPAVEPAEELGPVLLGAEEVVELEPELLREVADLRVALVDQLAAVLDDLPLGEGAAEGPAAAADPIRRLVDLGLVAGLAEGVRGVEPGEPGPDDDDPRRARAARRRGEAAERGQAERGDARLPDEPRPRRAPLAGGGRDCVLDPPASGVRAIPASRPPK
jgi:hypothetical protein